jgi:hypothetical protein
MKKFLVGIVSLVAAVMLTSPAFGALTTYKDGLTYYEIENVGKFSFDDALKVEHAILQPPPNPDNLIAQMEVLGGNWPSDITFSYKFEDQSGLIDDVDFPNPVQIVVAKWGQGQSDDSIYAFLLSGYTTHFDWNLYGRNEMSHVGGYNAVPVPAAAWLLGSGALGLVAIRRRRS